MNTLETKNGLLYYPGGRELTVEEADYEARERGFAYAEQLVKTLEKSKPKSPRKNLQNRIDTPRLDLSPSHADRWTSCTASPQFLVDNAHLLPPRDDTKYNTEGTTAHELAAAEVEGRQPDEANPLACPVPATDEMRWHAFNFGEYVANLYQPGCRVWVESKLPLWYMPTRNAKVDVAILNHNHSIHIVDYKYGAGIVVSPNDNLQCAIYARSVVEYVKNLPNGYPPENFPIFVHIYQPRGRAAVEGESHVWETTWGAIHRMTELLVSQPAAYILGSEAPIPDAIKFRPSKKACQWCPAKGFCTARKEIITADVPALRDIGPGMKLPEVGTIGIDQLAAVVKYGDQIARWIKDAEAYALTLAKGGTKIPGFKIVQTRQGNRTWSDEKLVKAALLADTHLRPGEVVTEKVISPAEVDKLLGKKGMPKSALDLIYRSPGKPELAPETDKRSEWLINATAEFADFPQDPDEVQPE